MQEHIERIAAHTVDAAIRIHQSLGPGLFETVYESILAAELEARGHQVERQKGVPIRYQELEFDEGFRADLLIDRCFIVEVKSVEKLAPVHFKQLLTYLRLLGFPLGLLINFGEALVKDGIKRVAN